MQRFLLISLSGLLIVGSLFVLLLQKPQSQNIPKLENPIDEMPIGFEAAKTSIRIVDENEQSSSPQTSDDRLIARLPSAAPKPTIKKPQKTLQRNISIELVRPLVERAGWMTTDDYTISLNNIEAPSPKDWCQGMSKPWPCGPLARTAMRKFIRGRTAICITQAQEDNNSNNIPRSAQCLVGGVDVAKWLVEQGWAIADAGSELEKSMAVARDKKKGLWRNGTEVNLVARPKG